MSSMRRAALFLPLLLGVATAGSTQNPPAGYAPARPMAAPQVQAAAYDINYALADWRRLRSTGSTSFADYARFLIANPGWPGDSTLRRNAERVMRPGESAATVLAFYRSERPLSGNGHARLADALAATGRAAEALQEVRSAWASSDLGGADESAIFARWGAHLTRADHDRRADALLFDKKPLEAQRFLDLVSPARRASFAARVALQTRSPAAESLYQSVIGSVTSDAGLMMDRARYLRESGYEDAARQLFARQRALVHRPGDVDRFLEMMLLLAEGAASDRQHALAYNIARQLDDLLPPGSDVNEQALGVRDKYTSLAWLAGTTAWSGLGRPADAAALFDRYSRGGRSLQVLTKGLYWAGKAAVAAGRLPEASNYFSRAAAYPELFYGQLALERIGRAVPAPNPLPTFAVTPAQRSEFLSRRLVQAVRLLGQQRLHSEQTLFVRALAESLDNDGERTLAIEFGRQLARDDLAVWVGRAARNKGSAFYVEDSYPRLPVALHSARMWSLAHGITRQESSFDRAAVSHAGARGMMQLMPGTAREQAGKMGLAYDNYRLTADPSYNVMLGSAYFQRMLDMWDGNVPLAVASYNAGYGNVRKWVARYGDPRDGRKDVLQWIEQIPFMETRGYVQRVIENSVVYDRLNPGTRSAPVHVSLFLNKTPPG